ncbi:MAG: M20/M25/M40 family metallo-hydrolase [Bryobacteraceae bacterium]
MRTSIHRLAAAAGLLATALSAQDIAAERLRAHVRFLSSDLLEGRAPGTRGGELTVEYLASQLAVAGAKPAGASPASWFQPVPLLGVTASPETSLQLGGIQFRWLEDFAGGTLRQTPDVQFTGDAVFAGFGIHAPEFGWDDYGSTDVRGKLVLLFANEPASESGDFFGGRALTYYGRWTYKYEEAARRGAAAVLIMHTDATAGYGWDVVRNSWGREDAQVRNAAPGAGLAFAGWISEAASRRVAAAAGTTLARLLERAGTKGFRAVSLGGLSGSGKVFSRIRAIAASNVLGRIEGSRPEWAAAPVLFTAHWDHLGKTGQEDGDAVYNGAVDNATGCALLLEIARAWGQLPVKPGRPALFLFTTAEEAGLRGAEYFVQHPVAGGEKVALDRVALVLNFDSFFPFGPTRDLVLAGAERTTWAEAIIALGERYAVSIEPDPRPEQGGFFRSDHFPFAQAGVAALSIKGGRDFMADPENARAAIAQYGSRHYHRVSDEFRQEWDFSGMEQVGRFGMALGLEAANSGEPVRWRPK